MGALPMVRRHGARVASGVVVEIDHEACRRMKDRICNDCQATFQRPGNRSQYCIPCRDRRAAAVKRASQSKYIRSEGGREKREAARKRWRTSPEVRARRAALQSGRRYKARSIGDESERGIVRAGLAILAKTHADERKMSVEDAFKVYPRTPWNAL